MSEEHKKAWITGNKVFKSWIIYLLKMVVIEQARQAIYHFQVICQGNNWCQEILTNVGEHQAQQDASFTGRLLEKGI